jgi:hypothetical protein
MDEVIASLKLYILLGMETEIYLEGYKFNTVKDNSIIIISRKFYNPIDKEYYVVIGQVKIKDLPNFIKCQTDSSLKSSIRSSL